jgi:hypothetical protein
LPLLHPLRTTRATLRGSALVALLIVLSTVAVGCGGDDSSSPSADPPAGRSSASSGPAEVATKLSIGAVAGTIRRPFRKTFADHRPHLQKKVGAAVDSWLDGAFVGVDYPRDDFPHAFTSFTAQASRDARREHHLMTDWAWRHKIDGVTVRHRSVTLDVLAPRGRPAGVTAHVRLVFKTTGKVKRRVSVTGRLFLAQNPHGAWRIFGYDVAQGAS